MSTKTNTTTHFLRDTRGLFLARDVAVAAVARGTKASIWTVGCSTGDEPHGIALLCREADVPVEILATDVNPDALAVAARGRYPARNLRHVDPARRGRWFTETGGEYQVIPEAARLVRFLEHDVRLEGAPAHAFDLILCRNVMVYFNAKETCRAVATMTRALAPGGLLVLAATEWLPVDARGELVLEEVAGVMAYRRPVDGVVPVRSSGRPRAATAPVEALSVARKERPTVPVRLPTGGSSPFAGVEPPATRDLRAAGDAHFDAARPVAAAEAYARALALAPLAVDLHLRMALAQIACRDTAAAEKVLRQCVFIAPSLWPAWLLLAELMLNTESSQTAHAAARALELIGSADGSRAIADPLLAPFLTSESAARSAASALLRRAQPWA